MADKVTVIVSGMGVEAGTAQVSITQAKKACWNNFQDRCIGTEGWPKCNLTINGCFRKYGPIAHPNQLMGVKITPNK